MLDTNDPVTMAMVTLIVTFILLVGILYLANPMWLQVINQTTGKGCISWRLLFAYSATFSIVSAIGVIMIVSKKRNLLEPITSYQIDSSILAKPEMVYAYCGAKHSV